MKLCWLFLLLLALPSCHRSQRYQDRAKERFSDSYSCPADRVEVREREDLAPSSFDGPVRELPPDHEIRRDPERYEHWRNQQQERRERGDSGWDCFELTGCGHHEITCCADADVGGVICDDKTRD